MIQIHVFVAQPSRREMRCAHLFRQGPPFPWTNLFTIADAAVPAARQVGEPLWFEISAGSTYFSVNLAMEALKVALSGNWTAESFQAAELLHDPADLSFFRSLGAVSAGNNQLFTLAGLLDDGWYAVPPWVRSNFTGVMIDMDAFDGTYRQALLTMIHALDAAGPQEYWPTEGTLIALLRYGSLPGKLSQGKVDVVDKDIQFMLLAQTEDEFSAFVERVRSHILARGGFRRWTCLPGAVVFAQFHWRHVHPAQYLFENDYFSE